MEKDRTERKLENILSQISVDYIDKKDNDYNLTIIIRMVNLYLKNREKEIRIKLL